MMEKGDLRSFFYPESVAIIGASQDFTSIGGKPLRNLIAHGFKGNIFPVNPKYPEISGLECYPSLAAIPGSVDVALIAVSQKRMEETIQQCIEKKVKYAVVFSAGFAEVGEEGKRQQEELVRTCQRHGLRFTGPNCIGSINVRESIPLGFSNTFEAERFIGGNVGLVSQSGALGYAVFALAQQEGIGFSYVANTGNQADLNTLDFLQFMLEDEDTIVLGAYMEAIPDGKKMKEIALGALEAGKPMVIFKAGRSELGQAAAMSHTGSLAGSDQAFRAFAKQYAITVAKDSDDFIDAVKAFNRGKLPKGNRVAVISTSGATGIMMADNCSELGLVMASLSEETNQLIQEVIPSFGSAVNPIDITAQALNDKGIFSRCLEILVSAEEVDVVVVTTTFGRDLVYQMAGEIIDVDQMTEKPMLVALTGPEELVGKARKRLQEARVPVYNSVWSLTASIRTMVDYKEQTKVASFYREKEEQKQIIVMEGDGVITEPEVKKMLNQFSIPSPRGAIVYNLHDIQKLSAELTFPLAAKVISRVITHKSDVGGVILRIRNHEELEQAFLQLSGMEGVEGVLIEEMAGGPFLEMIVGVKRDPVLGPLIMCGLGGVYVEIMKDISHRMAPLSRSEAITMIQELKCYPLFAGYRNGAVYDIDALCDALVNISEFSLSLGNCWTELEINPLIVRPKGSGVLALDGLITGT